jgi:hypothetical protein
MGVKPHAQRRGVFVMRHLHLTVLIVLLLALIIPTAQAARNEVTLPNGEKVTVKQAGTDTVMTLANGVKVTRSESGNSVAWKAPHNVSDADMDKAEQAYQIWAEAHGVNRKERGRSVPIWVALLMLVAGLLNLFNPRLGWYLSEGWKFKDAEPSDLALGVGRVIGGVLSLVGLGLLFAG